MTVKYDRTGSTFWLLASLSLGLTGCSEKVIDRFLPNLQPDIRLTQAPINSSDRVFYAYRMNWVGSDPDGRVDYFLYAVDPANVDQVDETWVRTTKNEETVFFRATNPDSFSQGSAFASDPHVFAVRAVDDKGMHSETAWRAFTSSNQCPVVAVENPSPGSNPLVTPAVRIFWRGRDPDGQFTQKPVKYKYRLFGEKNPDFPGIDNFILWTISNRDSFRAYYAPTFGPSPHCPQCAQWDSSSADTTEVQYTNLVPNEQYMFIVTGYDEAGAYDPVFSTSTNLLTFLVTYAGTRGPVIFMANQFFNYLYPNGGYVNDPSRYVDIEVPADITVGFFWTAFPPAGAQMRRYRWVLSSPDHPFDDLTDETPRFPSEAADPWHWGAYSLNNTIAILDPRIVTGLRDHGSVHLFYIEAEDNNGLKSLGIIRFTVVRASFDKNIVFVDDTRLAVDGLDPSNPPYLATPSGPWPNSAELDSFLFAQGGNPMKGYPVDPFNVSQPGVFKSLGRAGDPVFGPSDATYDTIGSLGFRNGLVPLSFLGKYKHVVWYVDTRGATYNGDASDPTTPRTALRQMSQPGQLSTLSVYINQGGTVWLFGGATAYATLTDWNARNTDPTVFTARDFELVPGRFMYDFPRWQVGLATPFNTQNASRNDRVNFPATGDVRDSWGAMGRGWAGQPDYNAMPSVLQRKSCSTDPPPALRFCDSFFLQTNFLGEVIHLPTFIVEDLDRNPDTFDDVSMLDTLYAVRSTTAPGALDHKPIMTHYHGHQNPAHQLGRSQVVFSGFPLWYFRKGQATQLAEFVMHDPLMFALPRVIAQTNAAAASPAPAGMTVPMGLGIRRAQPGRGAALSREELARRAAMRSNPFQRPKE